MSSNFTYKKEDSIDIRNEKNNTNLSNNSNRELAQLFSTIGNQSSIQLLGLESSPTQRTQDSEQNIIKKMENHFNSDFSNIKIHENSTTASNINALAYTQGNDIHFAPGEFNPSTTKGKHLLSHELTHVVQQRNGRVKPTREINGMPINDNLSLEREADTNANKIIQGYNINSNSKETPNNCDVVQGTFRASARILPSSKKVDSYSASELSVPSIQFSEYDRPDTYLSGKKQGKHVTAWTFMMRFWENYFTGNLKDVFKKLFNEMNLLEYLEDNPPRDKIRVFMNYYYTSETNPYTSKHSISDWVTLLNTVVEHFANTYQESKLTVRPGTSKYRGEGHAKSNLDEYESNIELYDEKPDFEDVKTQVYKFMDISKKNSPETRKLAYRNVYMGLKFSWPSIFNLYKRQLRKVFESDLSDITDSKLSFDYMFPGW